MRWTLDLLDYFVATRLLHRRVPLLASFKVTYRCNLACAPCPFHVHAARPGAEMDWETAVRSLDHLRRRGTRLVIFEGGEPLLWRDGERSFADLVHQARKSFLRVGATTNGTLPLDVPTDVLWVSVDGTKKTHDAMRGGSFDQVWANLRTARHPKLLVHFTANRLNWRELGAVLEMLRDVPAVRGLTVQLYYPYGGPDEDPLALAPEDRRAAVAYAVSLRRKGYPILNSEKRLLALADGGWECRDWMLANVDPDGTITTGCYVKGRGEVRCDQCGFSPVAEASGAFDLMPGSLLAGWRTLIAR